MPSWGEVLDELRQLQQPRSRSPHDELRRNFLRKLSEHTNRDVILYSSGWTHTHHNSPRQSIVEADLQGFMETIYGTDSDELDLILHSPGGTPASAEGIVDYMRSKFDHVRIFVPHAAMSAATMICCAADELVMGRHSFLGPIDPQITLDTPTGVRSVPAEAILTQFDQAKKEIEEDNDNLAQWTPILRQYGPGLLVECEQAVNLSEELAKTWAENYMFSSSSNPQEKAEELAESLSKWEEFKSHSRHISRSKAREFGFEVSDLEDDQELQDIVLSIYHTATHTHANTGVDKIIENQNENAFIMGGPDEDQQPSGGSSSLWTPTFNTPPSGPSQEIENS